MNHQPYTGPGMWIRIQHRFGPRMTEWFMAAHMLGWGILPLLSPHLFQQESFAGFYEAFGNHERWVGAIMVLLAVLRFLALIVNGARKDVTPHIRQFSAGIGLLIWVGISYCYASSNVVSTWLAIYPLFAIGELVNIYRAAHDQGEARNGRTR